MPCSTRSPSVVDRPGAKALAVSTGTIRFEGVVFRYPDGTQALDGVDLVIPGGKTTAFVGRSGAGKSTVFGLLPRLYDLESGRITIDGTDIAAVTLASLRSAVGVVTQEPFSSTTRSPPTSPSAVPAPISPRSAPPRRPPPPTAS